MPVGVFAATDLVNVAAQKNGAQAIADSEYGKYSADNVIDGVFPGPTDPPDLNRWHSALNRSHPHWIWVQFRERVRVEKIIIHRADGADYPVDFVGEYSPDGGATFFELFSVTNNSMSANKFAIEKRIKPLATDNFRLRILRSSHQDSPNEAQISELEVFGEFIGPNQSGTSTTTRPTFSHNVLLKPSDSQGVYISNRPGQVEISSKWLRAAFATNRPALTALSWDSLGEAKVKANFLKTGPDEGGQTVTERLFRKESLSAPIRFERQGNVLRYWHELEGAACHWETRVEEKRLSIAIEFNYSKPQVVREMPALHLPFDPSITPVAPIANPRPNASAPLPLLLHAADYGTLLVESVSNVDMVLAGEPGRRNSVRWDANIRNFQEPRELDGLRTITTNGIRMDLEFTVVNASPLTPALIKDFPAEKRETVAGFARSWLNTFQYRPDIGILANNPMSDNAALCLFTYTDPAVFTPTLPGGVEAINLARESLDQYFRGSGGYGVGREDAQPDIYPSLLISAWDVIRVTGDMKCLHRWLPRLEEMGQKLIALDRNGNGLPESTRSGVSGEFHGPTGNWWDQINFGHEDAYVCALAYRAFNCLADLEQLAGHADFATKYKQAAEKIRTAYSPTFLDPESGVIAGWKDAKGNLHDYWFTFVNGMAIAYGLVPNELANSILDRFQAKMKEVGFTRFDLGLPGNLVPIPKSDYGIGAPGSSKKDDGRDGFGVFENGGATAAYAYYYIQALYQTGRRAEAEKILWPMLESYAKGKFQNGVGHGGEWTRWEGSPSGFEGFLADSYYTQMALFTGCYGMSFGPEGFRLEQWSPLAGRDLGLDLKYMGRTVKEIR